jgi:predicted TIM-barrel fold metal-dependent hydrolase
MSKRLDFPVFDADNHLYEAEDAFTRYLPKELASLFRYVNVDGRTKVLIRSMLSDYIPNPTFEVVARPGSSRAYFSGNNPEGKSLRELMGEPMRSIPAYRNPKDRLTLLDELGIDAALMFPTLASLLEVNFLDLPKVTMQLLQAFNRWLLDEWTYNYEDRIFSTPVLNPCIPDDAIAELDFILEHGAKVALLRPGVVAGNPMTRSPFLPEFDPFWARVQESGILIAIHASDSGYQRYVNDWEGRQIEYSGFKPSPFMVASQGSRAITDTFFSAICHGMLTRFPGVRLLSVENGGAWVIPALKQLDSVYKKLHQDFKDHPRDTFLRSVWVCPFWEDSIEALIDEIGIEHVCFGSDYPHPEGLEDPLAYADELSAYSVDDIRKVMGANMYGLLGARVPA